MRGLPYPVRSPSCSSSQGCGWQGSVEGTEPSGPPRGAQRTCRRTEGLFLHSRPWFCTFHCFHQIMRPEEE